MDRSLVGIIAPGLLSVPSALVYHIKVQDYLVASVLAAVTASVLFQIIGYFVEGSLDPFFIVAIVVGGVAAFIIALVVGIPIAYVKKERDRG